MIGSRCPHSFSASANASCAVSGCVITAGSAASVDESARAVVCEEEEGLRDAVDLPESVSLSRVGKDTIAMSSFCSSASSRSSFVLPCSAAEPEFAFEGIRTSSAEDADVLSATDEAVLVPAF